MATIRDVSGSTEHTIGTRTSSNGALTLTGYWDTGSDNTYPNNASIYGNGSVPTMQTGSGYFLFSFYSDGGTYSYSGRTVATLSGGYNTQLRWGGYTVKTLSIGGPVTDTRVKAWSGVVIEKVALFVGETYTASDIAEYEFPTQSRWHDNDTYAFRGTTSKFHESTLMPVDAFDALESETITLDASTASYYWTKFCNKTGNSYYYYAPGCALFYDATGYTAASDAQFGPLTLGGLYVTSPQTVGDSPVYYSITGSGDRKTELGDPTGKKETFFVFDESFTISRNDSNSIKTPLYGVVNISVASDKTFALNTDYTATILTTAGDTAPVLKMSGAGKFAVSSLDASTGTLDFSGVTATPFIQGDLTVSATTCLVLPAGTEVNASYVLCMLFFYKDQLRAFFPSN